MNKKCDKSTDKRRKIRVFSFISAAVLALAVWGISETVKVKKYERQLMIDRQRTVASLASYIDSLETDLRKMQYVSTPSMTSNLALSLSREVSGAKNCLSELDSGTTQLFNINKFLSQAGDYVQSMNKRLSSGEKLGEKDRAQIKKLYEYSVALGEKISYLEEVMYSGKVEFEQAESTLGKLTGKDMDSLAYFDTVSDAETSFSDYPTLIYDGPFSDNIMNRESRLLKNAEEITEDQAKTKAAQYSGIEKSKLLPMENDNSRIASYVFYCDGVTVAVTKRGGYLNYIISDKFAGEEKIKKEEAVKIAKDYLDKIGYPNMKESYFYDSDGICTVNFAYSENGIIYYPDLIKVSVSLNDSSITSSDASGFIMNHRERSVSQPKLTKEQAAENISDTLTVKKTDMALIPEDDGNERLTYEFLCTDNDSTDILIYIDSETGMESRILLLLYSDGGTLTK